MNTFEEKVSTLKDMFRESDDLVFRKLSILNKTNRPLIIPFAWLIGIGAILFTKNFSELNSFLFESYVPMNILMGAIIPLVLLIMAIFRLRIRNRNQSDIKL